ncbi:MAG: TOBE-like domain-containing protein, partial [Castellaniella sp.]
DAKVRKELRRWLRRLHDELHMTSLFVTHDQEEALEVADEVVIMNKGRVEQQGAPQAVYDTPETAFVYGFLGHVNLFQGRVRDGRLHTGGAAIEMPGLEGAADAPGTAYVRPHDIQIEPLPAEPSADPGLRVNLQRAHAFGPLAQLELRREDTQEIIEVVMPSLEFDRIRAQGHRRFIARPRQARVFLN